LTKAIWNGAKPVYSEIGEDGDTNEKEITFPFRMWPTGDLLDAVIKGRFYRTGGGHAG
jgi:hypothetical protein